MPVSSHCCDCGFRNVACQLPVNPQVITYNFWGFLSNYSTEQVAGVPESFDVYWVPIVPESLGWFGRSGSQFYDHSYGLPRINYQYENDAAEVHEKYKVGRAEYVGEGRWVLEGGVFSLLGEVAIFTYTFEIVTHDFNTITRRIIGPRDPDGLIQMKCTMTWPGMPQWYSGHCGTFNFGYIDYQWNTGPANDQWVPKYYVGCHFRTYYSISFNTNLTNVSDLDLLLSQHPRLFTHRPTKYLAQVPQINQYYNEWHSQTGVTIDTIDDVTFHAGEEFPVQGAVLYSKVRAIDQYGQTIKYTPSAPSIFHRYARWEPEEPPLAHPRFPSGQYPIEQGLDLNGKTFRVPYGVSFMPYTTVYNINFNPIYAEINFLVEYLTYDEAIVFIIRIMGQISELYEMIEYDECRVFPYIENGQLKEYSTSSYFNTLKTIIGVPLARHAGLSNQSETVNTINNKFGFGELWFQWQALYRDENGDLPDLDSVTPVPDDDPRPYIPNRMARSFLPKRAKYNVFIRRRFSPSSTIGVDNYLYRYADPYGKAWYYESESDFNDSFTSAEQKETYTEVVGF